MSTQPQSNPEPPRAPIALSALRWALRYVGWCLLFFAFGGTLLLAQTSVRSFRYMGF